MATGDTLNGLGGNVASGGTALKNIKKWSLTAARNIKKYGVAGLKAKRAVGGISEWTGTMECELEEGERSSELNIDGATLAVSLAYDASNNYACNIVVENVQEGVNMDDGQVDTVVIAFSVDGEPVRTGVLTGATGGGG